MRRILACLCLLCAALAFAQQALNNDAVIKMVKAGLSDEVVIATVNASPGTYDTTTDGLIALKSAGVSDKVVAAIIARNAGAPPSPSVSTSAPGTAPSTATGVPPGIDTVGVYYRNKDGVWNEVDAEVVNFKTGGVLKHIGSVGIIKGDVNGNIGGSHSRLPLTLPAEFIFDVPEGTSPGEYQLLKLRLNADYREFRSVTGGVAHTSGGATRDNVEYTSRKIAPRIYEITLNDGIVRGEYGFLPPVEAGSGKNIASSGKIYTFSIVE
ncbi:MAG: hypothetical protein WCC27_11365 [Acidobacteriaceae bacterium]